MDQDQLEFAITRYLEGDLQDEEARALDEILRTDERARLMLTEHWKLTSLVRAWRIPDIAWEELSADLSAMVTGKIGPQVAIEDQKLQSLLANLPPLPAIHWDRLATQISNAVAAEVNAVDSDEALTAALRTAPIPAINWNALSAQISTHITASEAQAEERLDVMLRSTLAPELNWAELSQQIQSKIQVVEAHEDARLDNVLKSQPIPAVNFDRLAQHISAEVAAVDAKSEEQLTAALSALPATPAVKWEALATHLSQSVTQAADEQSAAASAQREHMRIGWGTKWMRNITRLAIAAVVALAAAVGIRSYLGSNPDNGGSVSTNPPTAVAIIESPKIEEAAGAPVVDIKIGPADSYAAAHSTASDLDSFDSAPVVFALPVRVYEDNTPGIFE